MLTLHTASLKHYGLNRIFEFAKESGFEGIEIGVDKNDFDSQNAEYLKKLSEKYGLPIVALHAPNNGSVRSVEHVVQMAEFLACPLVVITPPRLLDFKLISWLKKEPSDLRQKKHIKIALSNAPGRTIFGFLPERTMNSLRDLKKFGSVALDTSATVSKKWDLIRTYEHLKDTIAHLHLSNVRKHKEYSLPGEGILPLESLLRKLKRANYKGAVSLLIHPMELHVGNDEEVVDKLKTARTFVEKWLS